MCKSSCKKKVAYSSYVPDTWYWYMVDDVKCVLLDQGMGWCMMRDGRQQGGGGREGRGVYPVFCGQRIYSFFVVYECVCLTECLV